MGTNRRFKTSVSALLVLLAVSATAPAQSTTRVSVDASGVEGDNWSGGSWTGESSAISSDDRWIAFRSVADNLVAGDTNVRCDIFVKELATGAIVRVSVDSAGVQGNNDSFWPSLSADGRFVAFTSLADNLVAGDTNHTYDVFVHDRDPDGNGIFDEGNGVTTRVSVRSNGAQGNLASYFPMISSDGSTVVFCGYASNLVAGDTNGVQDVFAHDRITGKTRRISVDSAGNQADGASFYSAVSADGKVVAFSSYASNLVAGDTNGTWDVFVRDRKNGVTTRVSVDSAGVEGNGTSDFPSISADGNLVSFQSKANDLVAGDTNTAVDVFVHDRTSAATERVSVDSGGGEANGDSTSSVLGFSADGRFVTFASLAPNLVSGDTNYVPDVFVRDRKTSTTTRVSVDSSGLEGDLGSSFPGISPDGELVAFKSSADNLVANDGNGVEDVFVRNRGVAIAAGYGAGSPGTLGIPTLVASGDPVLGSNLTVTISNSLGVNTPGIVLLGFDQADLDTGKGGTLLVVPFLSAPLLVHAAGESLSAALPNNPALSGIAVDMQALELDSGASKGISFTAGLKLLLGF